MVKTPSKDLKEKIRHGTEIFPMAGYLWHQEPFPERVHLHWHPEIEIIRVLKGSCDLQINLTEVKLTAPCILIIPANMLHGLYLPTSCSEEALLFNASSVALSAYDEVENEILESLSTGNMPLPPVITLKDKIFTKINALIEDALNFVFDQSPASRLKTKARVIEILSICYETGYLSRKALKIKSNVKDNQQKLKQLLTYVDNHYAGPITISDASAQLGVTNQYFCRFFKKATGMSFTEYLNDLRLRHAAVELAQGTANIADIAYNNGFENAGYFFRVFKSKYKITPLQYRKQVQMQK